MSDYKQMLAASVCSKREGLNYQTLGMDNRIFLRKWGTLIGLGSAEVRHLKDD